MIWQRKTASLQLQVICLYVYIVKEDIHKYMLRVAGKTAGLKFFLWTLMVGRGCNRQKTIEIFFQYFFFKYFLIFPRATPVFSASVYY